MLCGGCEETLGWLCGRGCCEVCSHPFEVSIEEAEEGVEGMLCPNCQGYPMHFTHAVSPLRCVGVVRELIHQFKYQDNRPLERLLVNWLWVGMQEARLWGWRVDCVVPVPLHPLRLRERGYNQAALLAQGLAKRLGVPYGDVLKRARWTATQTQFTRRERMRNLDGAFVLRNPALGWLGGDARGWVSRIEGRQVLLVDDVFTTGATLNACARVLSEAGAAEVRCITVARR